MYLYNNTQPTLKYFQKDKYHWVFAVVRQGFYDYTKKIVEESKLFKNRQYIFFKKQKWTSQTKTITTRFC